jgi:hypothetical protein
MERSGCDIIYGHNLPESPKKMYGKPISGLLVSWPRFESWVFRIYTSAYDSDSMFCFVQNVNKLYA